MSLSANAFDRVAIWLASSIDDATKNEIRSALENNPESLEDAFYTSLKFGTAGMRGIMGLGSNRMNIYTVGLATQALVTYIQRAAPTNSHSVVIGYDCRTHSLAFAQECARVVAGAGFTAYLFDAMRPTPMVSFGCRMLKSTAGIMITASHNAAEYNGYKVFWSDGGQVLPPHDIGIMTQFKSMSSPDRIIRAPLSSSLIQLINIDRPYLDSLPPPLQPEILRGMGSELKVLFTNLHGIGATILPQALERIGISNLAFVPEQKEPDGTFPTTKSPNPEEESALKLGKEMLVRESFDLLIATDPDADRLGAVSATAESAVTLTGNQIFVLMTEYVLRVLSEQKKLPQRAVVIKSIVVTPLIDAICARYGVMVVDVLPGFKYFAEKLRHWEETPDSPVFIIGGEEAYGTLYGTHARDKDAIEGARLLVEVATCAKQKSHTLVDELHRIEAEFGIYKERLLTHIFPDTKEGRVEIDRCMEVMRKNPPRFFGGLEVIKFEEVSSILLFRLTGDVKVIIRSSGTEAKIKTYIMVRGATANACVVLFNTLEKAIQDIFK